MDTTKIYLVQTDTTVGFSSSDSKKLSQIKKRIETQKILQTVDRFQTLKNNTRIPKKFKNNIRRAKVTTFIYPDGNSFRVIDENSNHYNFISKFNKLYSTSANETGKKFELKYAQENSDMIVSTKEDYKETAASSIIQLYKKRMKKIR